MAQPAQPSEGSDQWSKAREILNAQGLSTKGIGGDLSAGWTQAIDSVTGGMANTVLAGETRRMARLEANDGGHVDRGA